MTRKQIKNIYIEDIERHSDITQNTRTAPIFEKYIADKIQSYLIESQKITNEIIFSGFVVNTYFDYVLITQNDISLTLYYLPTAEIGNLEIYTLQLHDTDDLYKHYFNLDIDFLPENLKSIVQKNNNNTCKTLLTAHRVITALKYNISGLDVHHIILSRFNPNGTLERLKQSLNINELLPCTRDFHLEILHNYVNDCITPEDVQSLTAIGFECLNELENYVNNINIDSVKSYKNNPVIIESILKDYVNGLSHVCIAEKYSISRPTVARILNDYEILSDWV